MSLKKALYEAGEQQGNSWFSTYQLIVQNSGHHKVKAIVDDFDLLISWLQAFYVLNPIADDCARECFVARLKASRYTLNETRFEDVRPNGRPYALYACNCPTFIHYSLCKHCVARAMIDGIITSGPPQFASARREPEKQKPGRKRKAQRGGALDRDG